MNVPLKFKNRIKSYSKDMKYRDHNLKDLRELNRIFNREFKEVLQ